MLLEVKYGCRNAIRVICAYSSGNVVSRFVWGGSCTCVCSWRCSALVTRSDHSGQAAQKLCALLVGTWIFQHPTVVSSVLCLSVKKGTETVEVVTEGGLWGVVELGT